MSSAPRPAKSGFHSSDARGIVSAVDPATPLARGKGAEVGVRTGIIPGLQSSLSVWLLDLKSELVWAGDEGDNEASGPTRRYGVERGGPTITTPECLDAQASAHW